MPETPFPSLTKIWHTASYPAISPTRPEQSARGKVVVVTGGGTGIGANTARAFATAGSTQIALLGRTVAPLQETARTLESDFPGLKVLVIPTDITQKTQVDAAFDLASKTFGPVDVLVSNAGYIQKPGPVHDTELEDIWWSFEVHVKGVINVIQAFKRVVADADRGPVVVDVSSIVAVLPAWPQAGAYTASKMAGTKLWEYFRVENPEVRVVSIQPGRIETNMAKKIGIEGLDDVDLPSHFMTWLASSEASFLDGKFVCANWDVDELKDRKDEFEKTPLGTVVYTGFPSV